MDMDMVDMVEDTNKHNQVIINNRLHHINNGIRNKDMALDIISNMVDNTINRSMVGIIIIMEDINSKLMVDIIPLYRHNKVDITGIMAVVVVIINTKLSTSK